MEKKISVIAGDAEIAGVIYYLEEKLTNARKIKPDVNYSKNDTIIAIIKEYRENYLDFQRENRALKTYNREVCARNFILANLNKKFKEELSTLRTENEHLKDNLPQ